MKNISVLLLLSGIIHLNSFAQNKTKITQKLIDQEFRAIEKDSFELDWGYSKRKFNSKSIGDTLHYESFTNSLPANYTVVNNASNNFIWKWDTVNQASGSANIPRIKSITGASGFMSLPISFYNASSSVSMNTLFGSPKISISPKAGVYIQYQMYLAHCCNSSSELVLEVSTDSVNWDSYDLSQGLAINTSNADTTTAVTFETINLSPTLANQSEFWYRVKADGQVGYFIMLDDFAFVEGACNDLVLGNAKLEFNETNYSYNPYYGQIPCLLFSPLSFSGTIAANGGCDQTGVEMEVEILHLNTPGGGPATGSGTMYTSTANIGTLSTLMDSSVLTGLPRFEPSQMGSFQVDFSVVSDSIDQIPTNQTATTTFMVTDTVFARDDNDFEGATGPASFVDDSTLRPGGTLVGDRFGTLYILENSAGNSTSMNAPTSASFWVSNNPINIGVKIIPKIWEFNEDSITVSINAALGNEVASSFIPYTVSASDTNSLITLGFTSGSALINGLDSGQYVVGWEVFDLPTGTSFEVANDASTAANQPSISSFLYLAHAPNQGWGWVKVNPVIRLNMGKLYTCPITSSLQSNTVFSTLLEVSPNPSNGQLKVNITTAEITTYNLNVRNMLGQVVYTSTIKVNGATTERLELFGLEKGIYTVCLENENEKLLKKVILK